ncbi:hypothetical protein TNCV_4738161 [Trichonephila clavipes]|nr:hypothetical protein TNCV_4738161 [Trichonephila clavipes]
MHEPLYICLGGRGCRVVMVTNLQMALFLRSLGVIENQQLKGYCRCFKSHWNRKAYTKSICLFCKRMSQACVLTKQLSQGNAPAVQKMSRRSRDRKRKTCTKPLNQQ